MHDEILEQEAREGLAMTTDDPESVDAALDEMRDAGMFEVPDQCGDRW